MGIDKSDDTNALVASGAAAASPAPSGDPLAVLRSDAPLPIDPKTLLAGLRYLQERIPEYMQLSVEERRSMTRVANLDSEFLDSGIRTVGAWDRATRMLGRSAEELRGESDEIRDWDDVERALIILAKGIGAANLKKKHRFGSAILYVYNVLRITIRQNPHLRPYLDDMKRAFLRTRKKAGKAGPPAESEEPKETVEPEAPEE
jgi:hypothetical protein